MPLLARTIHEVGLAVLMNGSEIRGVPNAVVAFG
jgi:hypothetical protein